MVPSFKGAPAFVLVAELGLRHVAELHVDRKQEQLTLRSHCLNRRKFASLHRIRGDRFFDQRLHAIRLRVSGDLEIWQGPVTRNGERMPLERGNEKTILLKIGTENHDFRRDGSAVRAEGA